MNVTSATLLGLAIVLINFSNVQTQGDSDIDRDIDRIFNANGTNIKPVTMTTTTKQICVPYHLCDPDTNSINTNPSVDGSFIIDIRFGANKKCEHYLDVWCQVPIDYVVPNDTRIDESTPPPMVTSRPPLVTSRPPPVTSSPPRINECGIRNSNGVGLQITGSIDNEAEFGEFPWVVAVLKKNWVPTDEDTLAQCGGALIHQQVVLTAAHCTYKHTATELKIRAGEWDTQTDKEQLPFQERDVKEIIRHERFNPLTLYFDLALLVLTKPINWDRHIAPICLPAPNQIFTQRDCIVSGWGKDKFGIAGTYQVLLKKIELPMVDRNTCQDALRTKTRLGPKFVLDGSFVCAGGEAGKDACRGDGGGPLFCPVGGGRYEQAGIVAWGIGCGEDGVPGVYADVAQFRTWIDGHMNALNFGTNSYQA